jgi:secreted trypsin-like serine protease
VIRRPGSHSYDDGGQEATMKQAIGVLTALAAMLLGMAPASAIINGQPDGDAHPYVGLLVFDVEVDGEAFPAWRCTGSLISPTVVLTAGHCTDGADGARFWNDADVTSDNNAEYPFAGETSTEGVPHTIPEYCFYCTGNGVQDFLIRDVGVVVLDEPIELDHYAELPEIGLVDTLPNKQPMLAVGYGVSVQTRGGGQPVWGGPRIRMQVVSELVSGNHYNNHEVLRLSSNPGKGKGGSCFGDSGGPALLHGTDIIVGITSFGPNGQCTGLGFYSRADIAEVRAWIESFL